MIPEKWVIASSNLGKVAEIGKILHHRFGSTCIIQSLADYSKGLPIPEPEENGTDYLSNARIKARYYFGQLGLRAGEYSVIADDSGLECLEIDGYPGLLSARIGHSDEERRAVLLAVLSERLGKLERYAARFICHAVAFDGIDFRDSLGECTGEIRFEERGTNGFGYDPIFYLPDGRTMAELEEVEKNELSHRGIALRKLFQW